MLLSASLKQVDTTRLLPISNFHDHARFPIRKHNALSAISKLSDKKYPMFHKHYASTPQPKAPAALRQNLARPPSRHTVLTNTSLMRWHHPHCLVEFQNRDRRSAKSHGS